MGGPMEADREIAADVTVAVDAFPWVDGVYALSLSDAASAHPDALSFAITLCPYGITELVQTHYAVLVATGTHEVTGRVLYVNCAMPSPTPLGRARRITLRPDEREAARRRIEQRTRKAEGENSREGEAVRLGDLERAFRQLAENASRDTDQATASGDSSPYRVFQGFAITATFANGTAIVEVVRDPFPSPRRHRLLVADDDPTTEQALRALRDVDVIYASDGWTAIDHLTEGDFDLALCAVVLGDFTGAKIHRMVVKARPEMAARMVFIARASVVASAPPSSASARVIARPIDVAAVLALLTLKR